MTTLEEQIKRLPEQPGCYIFRDAQGEILYIGKAVSLKQRVRSYFQSARNLTAKVLAMVGQIASVEYITTDSEVEALILECNLIKRHRPKYNIRLRDDKNYPYLKVTLHEQWPRVVVARQMKKDGAKYYGPYTSAGAMNEALKLARRVFPLRTCKRVEAHARPCLEYHIGRCLGPCLPEFAQSGEQRERYMQVVRDTCAFFEGKQEDLLRRLQQRMEEAAEALQFERAAELRDQIKAIEQVTERQKMVSAGLEDQDLVAYARSGDETCVMVFFMREGKMVGREQFVLAGTEDVPGAEVLEAFLKQFYSDAAFIPSTVLVPEELPDAALIEEFLSARRGGRVRLVRPQRGEKKRLIELVQRNAAQVLDDRRAARERELQATEGAVEALQKALGLERPPRRIECFDISNIQGSEIVASMVVFVDGKPKKGDYRRFRIRSVQGAPNDFASMAEVIERRFRRGLKEREALRDNPVLRDHPVSPGGLARARDEAKFAEFPALVIIDGGKGQLSSARAVMHKLGLGHIPTFGLAKENEWLFREGDPDPIILPRDSHALFLVQRIRDEAHRFAITYHRKLHGQAGMKSLLDEVPGIGPVRKKALLKRFGSVRAIRQASVEELTEVEGMTRAAAEAVKEHLGGSV